LTVDNVFVFLMVFTYFSVPAQLFLTEGCELSGRRMSLDQIEHRGMIQVRRHDALEPGMYLCQQAADSVAGLGDVASQVIIEAAGAAE
jgi:hypothetical protein